MSKTTVKLSTNDVVFFAKFLSFAEEMGIPLENARAHFMNIVSLESEVQKIKEKEARKRDMGNNHSGRPELG